MLRGGARPWLTARTVTENLLQVEFTHVAEVVLASGETRELDVLFTTGQMLPNDSYLDELALDRNESPFGGSYIAAGSYAGGMCNMALTREDFDVVQKL